MADWYSSDSAGAQQRVRGAWSDAPVQNAELLGFLLNTARKQVIDFGEESIPLEPPVFEPVQIVWANGWRFDLAREGVVVTGVLTTTAAVSPPEVKPIPPEFAASGDVRNSTYNSALAPTLVVVLNEVPTTGAVGISVGGVAPANTKLTIQWVADPVALVPTIPDNWVLAQLMQARNLWNAGRTTGDGEVGPDGFTFRPMPLDKTIRLVIRPIDGKPHAL